MAQASSSSQPGPWMPKRARKLFSAPYWGREHRLPNQRGRHPGGEHRDVIDDPKGSHAPAALAEQAGHCQGGGQHAGDIQHDVAAGVAQHLPELAAGQNGPEIIQPDKMLCEHAGSKQLIQTVPVGEADDAGDDQRHKGEHQHAGKAGREKGQRGPQPGRVQALCAGFGRSSHPKDLLCDDTVRAGGRMRPSRPHGKLMSG